MAAVVWSPKYLTLESYFGFVVAYNLVRKWLFSVSVQLKLLFITSLKHFKTEIWREKSTCDSLHNPAVRVKKWPHKYHMENGVHRPTAAKHFSVFTATCFHRVSLLTMKVDDAPCFSTSLRHQLCPPSCRGLGSPTTHRCVIMMPVWLVGSSLIPNSLRTMDGTLNKWLKPVKTQLP